VSCSSSSEYRSSNQRKNICASRKVHHGHCEEIQDGVLQGHGDAYDTTTALEVDEEGEQVDQMEY
jgi:uncharacterized protein with FMN-binding domain